MFDIDLILAFLFMGLLFVRQIVILKQDDKINYAPIMVGVGVTSSIIHFIIHPDVSNIIFLFRESFLPLLVSILLYLVLNIMHQTQESEISDFKYEISKELLQEFADLRNHIVELEERLNDNQKEEKDIQDDMNFKLQQDIKSLETIKINQSKFLEKLDDMEKLYKNVSKSFDDFTAIQMPELDNIVHKHIDILRISEQDHFNQLKIILQKIVDTRDDISNEIIDLKNNFEDIKNISDSVSKAIVKNTVSKLSIVISEFEKEMVSLKSHTEKINLSLNDGETNLSKIKESSEVVVKQIILSSKKITEIENQSVDLYKMYEIFKTLIVNIENIKNDYVKSQVQLSLISKEFQLAENEQIDEMKVQIENLSEILAQRIDESLNKLHEHYHIADEDISKSVQLLAKRAQLQKGYV